MPDEPPDLQADDRRPTDDPSPESAESPTGPQALEPVESGTTARLRKAVAQLNQRALQGSR